MKTNLVVPALLAFVLGCTEDPSTNEWLDNYHDSVMVEQQNIGNDEVMMVTINLQSPLDVDDTIALLRETGVEPTRFMVFATNSDGTVGTLFTKAPIDDLASEVESVLVHENASLLGVAAIVGMLPASQVLAVQDHEGVYLVDPALLPTADGLAHADQPVAWEHFVDLGVID